MANLTITVEDEILEKARMRALAEGTSINSLLKACLEQYAGLQNEQAVAVREILDMSKKCRSRRGNARWRRDELHESR